MRHLGAVALVLLGGLPAAADRAAFDDGTVGFELKVGDHRSPYEVLAISRLPGETLDFEVAGHGPHAGFSARAASGTLREARPGHWSWTSPDRPGLVPIEVTRADPPATATLNVFVLVPRQSKRNGRLRGYRIGDYPTVALKGLDIYRPPAGFIEVTPDNVDTRVSPHFRLGQFLCKQEGGYPKYVVLRTRLLLKLELLLQQVNAAGIRSDGFHVMSGYRTPFYNRVIGNVKYSRHVYGGAADIFVDENPRDDVMDDLNGDGRIDVLDAGVLYDLFDGLYGRGSYEPFRGGLGRYKSSAAHGPFVHVDVRGFRARWGD